MAVEVPAAVRRVAVVFGTRPEAIKVAPIILALAADPRFEVLPVVSAQHREMLDQVMDLFALSPAADLDVFAPRQTLTQVTTRVLEGLTQVFRELQPDVVLVQGDTTTTMAGAMAAFYARIPVVHVEAGLRTRDRFSPYPEEVNRRLTTTLADLHLAPTPQAQDHLLREGVPAAAVVVTGNTVIDALRWTVDQPARPEDAHLLPDPEDGRRVVLVTTHRRESWGAPMRGVAAALRRIASSRPDLLVVLPMHRNPVVREALEPALSGLENVMLTEPLAYGAFSRLMQRAAVILTDSGGVQEEGPSLGKPVLVLRESTERPEAIAYGTARLIGTDPDRLVAETLRLLDRPDDYRAMATAVNPYGDGRAAERSVTALAHFLGLSDRVAAPFDPGPPPRRQRRTPGAGHAAAADG
ncbi:MAG: UDP-N-acetylglucosamine 2-epimerase (non-hydrolyzing) [Mycobacteriales bacterium]